MFPQAPRSLWEVLSLLLVLMNLLILRHIGQVSGRTSFIEDIRDYTGVTGFEEEDHTQSAILITLYPEYTLST